MIRDWKLDETIGELLRKIRSLEDSLVEYGEVNLEDNSVGYCIPPSEYTIQVADNLEELREIHQQLKEML